MFSVLYDLDDVVFFPRRVFPRKMSGEKNYKISIDRVSLVCSFTADDSCGERKFGEEN